MIWAAVGVMTTVIVAAIGGQAFWIAHSLGELGRRLDEVKADIGELRRDVSDVRTDVVRLEGRPREKRRGART